MSRFAGYIAVPKSKEFEDEVLTSHFEDFDFEEVSEVEAARLSDGVLEDTLTKAGLSVCIAEYEQSFIPSAYIQIVLDFISKAEYRYPLLSKYSNIAKARGLGLYLWF